MNAAPGAESPAGVVVGRYQGTVMVTVHGELDAPKIAHLGLLLTDLIEGQGNVAVIVDLQHASAPAGDPCSLENFAVTTKLAHGSQAVVVIDEPFASGLAARGGIGA